MASSRPDLIEVDLKRPGRIDLKIPLFPTTTARESFDLIRIALPETKHHHPGLGIRQPRTANPPLLTPGAAGTLAVKIYRLVRTSGVSPVEVLRTCLTDYQNPVPPESPRSRPSRPLETLEFQIRLAVSEASDLEFVPPDFRASRSTRRTTSTD